MTEDFNKWWDSEGIAEDNSYREGSPVFWAWEGWQAALKVKRECPNCERYKESAKNWRHKAYELSGHPLPWDRGDTWVGLTDEELVSVLKCFGIGERAAFARAIEAKLKEKNI